LHVNDDLNAVVEPSSRFTGELPPKALHGGRVPKALQATYSIDLFDVSFI
jgi:hypothetical protein